MLRNKLLPAVCLALLLPFCTLAESDNILDASQLIEQHNYNALTVTPGEFEQVFSVAGEEYFPYTYNLRVPVSGAKFEKYHVKTSTDVKAGDLLCTFTRQRDEVELETMRIALQRAEENRARQQDAYAAQLDALNVEYAAAPSEYERDVLLLKIRRLELERDSYAARTEHSIAQQRLALEEYEAELAICSIVAPCDGKVQIEAYKQPGDRLNEGELLMTITSAEKTLLVLENGNGYFRYGMDVTVEIGPNTDRVTLPGKIVAADMLVPEGLRSNVAFVEIDWTLVGKTKRTRPMVYAQVYYLADVLLTPKTAVTKAEGKHYVVTLDEDGATHKRYVNYPLSNKDYALILQGIDAGDKVIIN